MSRAVIIEKREKREPVIVVNTHIIERSVQEKNKKKEKKENKKKRSKEFIALKRGVVRQV